METSKRIVEFFECSCTDFDHTIRFSYYLPLNQESKNDNVIYVETFIYQWRTSFLPPLWNGFISLFQKDERKYSYFSKEYWKEFYKHSVWARFCIALRYLFTQKDEKNGIFDNTLIKADDLERLDYLLSHFAQEVQSCPDFQCEIESNDHRLQFHIERLGRDFPVCLATQSQFPKYGFIKRMWRAIKYAFGSSGSRFGYTDEFMINSKKDAAQLRYVIKEVQRLNSKYSEKKNDASH